MRKHFTIARPREGHVAARFFVSCTVSDFSLSLKLFPNRHLTELVWIAGWRLFGGRERGRELVCGEEAVR